MKNAVFTIMMSLMSVCLFSGLVFAASGEKYVEQPAQMESKLAPETAPTLSPPAHPVVVPFEVGEQLQYSIKWGKFTAGNATVSIDDLVNYQGHDVFRILVSGMSSPAVSLFYFAKQEMESLIDANGMFTRRYFSKIKENGKLRERLYEFDQENNRATYKSKNYYVPYGIHDEVSAVFYMRTLDLHVGQPINVNVFAKRRTSVVTCNVIKRETIKVPAGKFDTILVEPILDFDGVMKKGKMQVWFTDDERRIPVQVKSKMTIGSVVVRLEKYSAGNDTTFMAER
ncbi:hypothetical protein U14_01963 [Candidatus Moduliflexus flocculans]|uniref:DUF3108 domain-containing protein n=1 Tax=Candidatus Moduliflexus flocculans TaxID=1499966 RepID=A0A0S6VT80_9BACT|nr:hypothetical protein U14_01963 [Candidatus Moduliflexus flocculans]